VPQTDAIADLLGALAYGELCAFDRLVDDARMAPTLIGRAHDVAENGVDRAGDMLSAGRRLWEATEDGLGTARDNVRVAAAKTKTAIVDVASAADAGGRQTLGTVRDFVKARPVASLFIAIAAGLAIGKVLDRD